MRDDFFINHRECDLEKGECVKLNGCPIGHLKVNGMDKWKTAAIIGAATILLSVALDFLNRSFDRYCDLRTFERQETSSVESSKNVVQNRSSPLVEIVQTGVRPGAIEEEDL